MPEPTNETPELIVCRSQMLAVWNLTANPKLAVAASEEYERLSRRFAKLQQEAAQSAQAQEPPAQPQAA